MKKLIGALCVLYKIYVGLFFVSFLLLSYPVFFVLLSRPSWRKYSFPLFVFWSFLLQLCTLVFVVKLKKVKLPEGPYIIVSNHASYYDIFLLYSILPNHRFLFMGKSEILTYPLVKTFFKKLNIPVFRNDKRLAAKSFIQAKQALAEGWSIVLFPEGGIPDENRPQMIPFKEGAFKLAKSAKVPLVPLTFLDNHHIFSDPGDLDYAHPGISRVVMHPVISAEEVEHSTEKELLEKCFNTIAGPLKEKGLMK
jgi:1-acyl-sn-glycerol-3-phosphate acyltransferase